MSATSSSSSCSAADGSADTQAVSDLLRDSARAAMTRAAAGPIAAGLSAWKYSDDSLWMKIASGRRFNISTIASTLALTMFFSAVTNARSVRICSFHQPYLAEKTAQMNISLTGV